MQVAKYEQKEPCIVGNTLHNNIKREGWEENLHGPIMVQR